MTGGNAIAGFVDAVLTGSLDDTATTRSALEIELGAAAVVDVAAVIAMFSVMNRIADATGTPVDEGPSEVFVRQVANELGLQPGD